MSSADSLNSAGSKRSMPAFDLESKLRAAVVQSQLAASLKTDEPQGTPADRLNPSRIPRDLTNTLQSLWNSAQGVQIPELPPPTTVFPKRPKRSGSASGGAAGGGSALQGSPHSSPANSTGGSTAGTHHSAGYNPPAVSSAGRSPPIGSPGNFSGSSSLVQVHPNLYTVRPAVSEASSHSSAGSAGNLFSGPGRFRPPPQDDETMDGLSVDEWLTRVQNAQPVQLGAEYMEEDFYRGLDELSRAFNEFETLMAPEFRTPWQNQNQSAIDGGILGSPGGGSFRIRNAGDAGVTPEQLQQQHLLLLQRQAQQQDGSRTAAPRDAGILGGVSTQEQQQQQMLMLLEEQQRQSLSNSNNPPPRRGTSSSFKPQQQAILQGLQALANTNQSDPSSQVLSSLQGLSPEQQLQKLLSLQNQQEALRILHNLPQEGQQQQLALELLQKQQLQSLIQQHQLEELQRRQQAKHGSGPREERETPTSKRHRAKDDVDFPPELASDRISNKNEESEIRLKEAASLPHAAVVPNPTKLPSSGDIIALLVEVAKAIVANEHSKVKGLLGRLSEVASLYGNSTQRMSAYFLEGLLSRISGGPKTGSAASVEFQYCSFDCGAPLLRAFEVLVSSSPYLAFGHVASNSAILEAVQDCDKIHIVDFGLGHAVQWPALIQAFATRPGGPPHLTITGIDRPYVAGVHKGYCLRQAGQRLKAIAKEWNLPFTFHVLPVYLPELRHDMVKIEEGETVVVNCSLRLHSLMDESVTPSNPRGAVLKTMRALNPRLCTIVEQHTNHNSPFFLSRFLEALHYYSILFDSLDESVPSNLQERKVFEQQVLGRAIVNVVACEGQERTERQEPLGQWQRRVERAGFLPCPLSEGVVSTASALLSMYEKKSYTVAVEPSNSLVLHWKDKPLLAMSAWVPNPYEGGVKDG